ncbi:MAG: hypothetical protein FIA97_01775 [Methylococcaceae bacterium]|nr:hypothetical protein [Methylococcaceae bacterium]
MNPRFRPARSLALALLALTATTADAALSSYTGSATLTYTFGSIENLTHQGDLSNLQITGSFEQLGAPYSDVSLTGDGSITANTPNHGPLTAVSPFTYTFSTSGEANNGTVSASHLGSYWLTFNNLGSDTYRINVDLGYQLNAGAAGQAADSRVHLDFYNQDSSFNGFAEALAFSGMTPTATESGTSGVFGFTLAQGGTESLIGDVTITGNVEATAVPLPPAIWFLLSGCVALMRSRRSGNAA